MLSSRNWSLFSQQSAFHWRTIVLANDIAYFTVGLFYNVCLIYLVKMRTPTYLKPYAKILLIHCVSDIFNEFCMFLMGVQTIPMNERMYFIPTGVLPNPDENPMITHIQCVMYVWIVIAVPVGFAVTDFGYRYLLLCHQIQATNAQFIGWIIFIYMMAFGLGGAFFAAFMLTTNPADIPKWQREEFGRALAAAGIYTPPRLFGVMTVSEPQTAFMEMVMTGWILWDYAFITYVVRRIADKTKRELAMDKRKANAYRQITTLMLIQAAIPLLLCIPTLANTLCCLLKLEYPNIGRTLCFLIPWLPALRPLATILIVPHYRRFLHNQRLSISLVDYRMSLTKRRATSRATNYAPNWNIM